MRGILRELKSPDRSSREREPISPRTAFKKNQQFFEASKHQETAPVISIYEGNSKVKIKASVENSDLVQPKVIYTNGQAIFSEVEDVSSPDEKIRKIRPGLEPYTETVVPKNSWSPSISKKKLTKAQFLSQLQDEDRLTQSVAPAKDEVDQYERRMISTTRDILSKSRELLQETNTATSKTKGKRQKGAKKEIKASRPFSSNDSNPSPLPDVSSSRLASADSFRTVVVSGTLPRIANLPPQQTFSSPALSPPDPSQSNFGKAGEDQDEENIAEFKELKYVSTGVPNEEIDGYFNKFDWENILARHILSVYATSNARSNQAETTAVLELIEDPTTQRSVDLKEQGMFSNLSKERKAIEKKAIRPGMTNLNRSPDHSRPNSGAPAKTAPEHISEKKKAKSSVSFRAVDPDPVKDVGLNGVEKLQKQNYKQRDEIHSTARTGGTLSVIRAPAKCFPIWFYSSADIYAEWIILPNGYQLQNYLDQLLEKKNYLKYVQIVKKILEDCWIDTQNQSNSSTSSTGSIPKGKQSLRKIKLDEIITENNSHLSYHDIHSLSRQFILACNAFATLCLENKDFSATMLLIRTAEEYLKQEDIFQSALERTELKAYIHMTLAYYFYRKKMSSAALSHSQQSYDLMIKLGKDDYIAMCLLMLSCCKYQVSNFKESHRLLYQILEMVETGRLSLYESKPKELCLIAIAYHNLAVIQMKLQVPDAAAKSSQNARKIARLCLSYSNKWINIFHWTHQLALEDVKYQLNHNYNLTKEQKQSMTQLMELLYEPHPI